MNLTPGTKTRIAPPGLQTRAIEWKSIKINPNQSIPSQSAIQINWNQSIPSHSAIEINQLGVQKAIPKSFGHPNQLKSINSKSFGHPNQLETPNPKSFGHPTTPPGSKGVRTPLVCTENWLEVWDQNSQSGPQVVRPSKIDWKLPRKCPGGSGQVFANRGGSKPQSNGLSTLIPYPGPEGGSQVIRPSKGGGPGQSGGSQVIRPSKSINWGSKINKNPPKNWKSGQKIEKVPPQARFH